MYKKILVLTIIFFIASGVFMQVHAQMMINSSNPSITVDPTHVQQQQQEEAQGKQFFNQLQNQQITCAELTDSDFEKIGEYTMGQMFGNNTSAHIAMNQRMQQMRGVTGEEQMHIQIGRSVTGCSTYITSLNSPAKGGVSSMMGWNGFGMMNGNYGYNGGFSSFLIVGIIVHVIIIVDLILLGVWLWKQIKKEVR